MAYLLLDGGTGGASVMTPGDRIAQDWAASVNAPPATTPLSAPAAPAAPAILSATFAHPTATPGTATVGQPYVFNTNGNGPSLVNNGYYSIGSTNYQFTNNSLNPFTGALPTDATVMPLSDGQNYVVNGQVQKFTQTTTDFSFEAVKPDWTKANQIKDGIDRSRYGTGMDPVYTAEVNQQFADAGIDPETGQRFITGELDNQGRALRNERYGEETTNLVFDRWSKVGGMALGLFDKILTAAWMSHRAGIENDMVDLAESKEKHQYNLQLELLQKQSTLQESAMKYDYQKARITASTEKYKAKLAADVKKSKIKQDSLKALFFPQNNYPYGNPHYA